MLRLAITITVAAVPGWMAVERHTMGQDGAGEFGLRLCPASPASLESEGL